LSMRGIEPPTVALISPPRMLSDHVAVAGATGALIPESVTEVQLSGQLIRKMESVTQILVIT
jgi:hypothetical protein